MKQNKRKERVLELLQKGMSYRSIAKAVGLASPSSIHQYAKDPERRCRIKKMIYETVLVILNQHSRAKFKAKDVSAKISEILTEQIVI